MSANGLCSPESHSAANEKDSVYPTQQDYPAADQQPVKDPNLLFPAELPSEPAGYPSQPPGYPPQPEYPSQWPGYPAQAGGYSMTGYFSEQKNAPPCNEIVPPPPQGVPLQQQMGTNVVFVVQQQPGPTIYTTTATPVGDNFLTLSIVMTVLCCLCCGYYALLCTVPAIVLSTTARDAEQRGDTGKARKHSRISMWLNISAVATWIVISATVAIVRIVAAANARDGGSSTVGSSYIL